MSPEQRKEASELLLHKRGIRLNLQLHVIESDDEVTLRSEQAVMQRMIALWLVSSAALAKDRSTARAYIAQYQIECWLSGQEREFMQAKAVSDDDFARFACRQEALYFLAWCGGLLDKLVIPTKPSALKHIGGFFQDLQQSPDALQTVLRLRRKHGILDWSDLLYRLHWAVRHAHLTGRSTPASLNETAVREWHQAANWICQYEEEHDWDKVSTET